MQDRFGQVMIQNLRVRIMSVRIVWDALDDTMHSVWTHVNYTFGNGQGPCPSWHLTCFLFCVLLNCCNYFGWSAIS